MGRRRHTPEQIITALREAEVGLARGKTVAMVIRELGISHSTGQLDDSADGNGHAQGPPTREDPTPLINGQRCFGNPTRLYTDFKSDFLELRKRQPALIGGGRSPDLVPTSC